MASRIAEENEMEGVCFSIFFNPNASSNGITKRRIKNTLARNMRNGSLISVLARDSEAASLDGAECRIMRRKRTVPYEVRNNDSRE